MTRKTKFVEIAITTVILMAAILIAGCSSYGPSPGTPATTQVPIPEPNTVTIQNFAFTPATITVPKGTTVTWTNLDSVNHQVISDAQGSIAEGAVFSSNFLPQGAGYSFRFDNPGTYPYHCSIHPSMKATVIVT